MNDSLLSPEPPADGSGDGRQAAEHDLTATLDWSTLHRAARRFGVKRFRPGQREIIEAVLAGRDVLGIMPSGAGKSLTYQLPALFLPKPTLVISPLLALIQDQQVKLADADVPAAKLDSMLTRSEEREIAEGIQGGQNNLIFMTPERLESPESVELLRSRGIALLVVDEAHCVSQWGHDFRPSYLYIRHARTQLGNPPMLALTATAAPPVAQDTLRELEIPNATVIHTGTERENLFLEVRRLSNKRQKLEALLNLLSELNGTGLVYTATVETSHEVCEILKQSGIRAANYHARLKRRERQDIQQRFMNDEFRVMVATKAFGMGIDKADIRFVIHYHFPDSLESYYQEAGRAGRDERPANAVLLYRRGDAIIQRFFLRRKYSSRADSERFYQAFAGICSVGACQPTTVAALSTASQLPPRRVKVILSELEQAGIVQRGQRGIRRLCEFSDRQRFEAFLTWAELRQTHDEQRLLKIMEYAESTNCRVRQLRDYFGEDPQLNCGHCDNCRAKAALLRRTA